MALPVLRWSPRRTGEPEATPRPETELIRLACQPRFDEAARQRVREIVSSGLDVAYLLLAGHRLSVLPTLHLRLKRSAEDILPAGLEQQLSAHYQANARKATAYEQEMEHVLGVLRSAGIEHLPLRVPRLWRCYEAAAMREVEPLEVLVPPAALGRARDALVAAGYRRVFSLTSASEQALLQSRPLPLHNDERNVRLHLHGRLLPSYFPAGVEPPFVRPISNGSDPKAALAPEDLLLYLCCYGSLHIWGKLAWVADVAWLLESQPGIDWRRLRELAVAGGSRRMLLLGLLLAADLLDARVDEALLAEARADARVPALASEVKQRFASDLRGRTAEMERMRFRSELIEDPLRRLRFWRDFLLTPSVEDLQALQLPDSLSPLYQAVRPARLAAMLSSRPLGLVRRAPFFSTPLPVVDHMLRMAELGPDDVLYDLGCGDGRIVIAAARDYGARGVGIDLDPRRIAESRANARAAGVDHLVSFIQADATKVDLTPATVITIWMLPDINLHLRPRLQKELRPGTRIVGHSFDMGDWLPEKTEMAPYGEDQVAVVYLWQTRGAAATGPPAPALAMGGKP